MYNTTLFLILTWMALLFTGCSNESVSIEPQSASFTKEDLGKELYFDKNLSLNRTQSCATCHDATAGLVDPRHNGVFSQASLGDDGISLGDRQAPTTAYASFSPSFHYDQKKGVYKGGQFWDGRVSTLKEQALGPLLNPIEMNMPSKEAVIERIKEKPPYIKMFQRLYGKDIFSDTTKAFEAIGDAIGSFETTPYFSPFDSKYDRYLNGEYELTPLEDLGLSLFFSNNNTSCATCHVSNHADPFKETFTNHEFHNIGIPINHTLRAKNGVTTKDEGLYQHPRINDKAQRGKFKVPTLRNVAVTAPYMHNGVFTSLRTVLEFYDKYNNPIRHLNPQTHQPWNNAEIPETINVKQLKSKRLNERKIKAIIAFLELLTDKRYEHLLVKKK